ncbi:hypothetical protein [Fibrella arboris]|uniref:hypothetical protein n=1 Tax=Fibrella arboris TaxID=3242486 RepID=UPI0035227698
MSKDAVKVGPASDDVKQQAGYFYDLLQDVVQPLLDRLDQLDILWSVVLAYARRCGSPPGQIEACWRFSKSELALQSPRLWLWANRLKLMMMVALVYAFLLSLLVIDKQADRLALLRHWCHRTGKRCQSALTPLYRLRAALAALLTTYQIITQTSG